jgi:hypothetical protein
MGKPTVCRTTELSLPIPASVQKKKNNKGTEGLGDNGTRKKPVKVNQVGDQKKEL